MSSAKPEAPRPVAAPVDIPGVELWRGGVNTWECDEMGHMNVRFYIAKAMEGLGTLAALLGMPDAFSPHAVSTLTVSDHHVRFLKEAHAGTALYMKGGVVALGETDATLLQVLVHARTGQPAATLISRVSHARPRDGKAFAWARRTVEAARALMVEVPAFAAPRSISPDKAPPLGRIAEGVVPQLPCIGRGTIMPGSVDVFGRMRAEEFIGRVSDGVPALLSGVREAVAASASATDRPPRVGGAVLEYRLAYLDWPRLGEHVALHSSLAGFDDKTQRMAHWLLNPLTGKAWGFAEAVAINFDLDARKAIPIAEAAKPVLQQHLRPGMRFGD